MCNGAKMCVRMGTRKITEWKTVIIPIVVGDNVETASQPCRIIRPFLLSFPKSLQII